LKRLRLRDAGWDNVGRARIDVNEMRGLFCLKFGSRESLSYLGPGRVFLGRVSLVPSVSLWALFSEKFWAFFFFVELGVAIKGNYDALRSDAFLSLSLLLLLLVVLSACDSLLISPVGSLTLPICPTNAKPLLVIGPHVVIPP